MTANKHIRVWLKQPCVVSAPSAFLGRKPQTEDLKPRDLSPQKRPVGIWPAETLGHTAYVDAMNLQCFASISDTANN